MNKIEKPRVFIGSSTEGLQIAYAIQEGLEFDSEPTVWSQGIFNLSKVPLSNLLCELNESDFAIFVFSPDDIATIRSNDKKIVRDNVLFEMGLFMGKLGQDKVFFVIPRNEENFHLASDLTGIEPGTYESNRSDKNLVAALGPFCNKVRKELKKHKSSKEKYQNIIGFEEESEDAKKIVLERTGYWEFNLFEKLLKSKFQPIQQSYLNIKKGLLFEHKRNIPSSEFIDFIRLRLKELIELTQLIKRNLTEEQTEAFGEQGTPGDPIKIKNCVDSLISYCYSLLKIESDLQSVSCSSKLQPLVDLMKGITSCLIDVIEDYLNQLEEKCNEDYVKANNNVLDINLKIDIGDQMEKINEFMIDFSANPKYYLNE